MKEVMYMLINNISKKCIAYNTNNFLINPKRINRKLQACDKIIHLFRLPFIKLGTWLGFLNIEYYSAPTN